MYPKVYFMDCTSWSNRQKHELFVSVMRSPVGKCFMSNVTVIPSDELHFPILKQHDYHATHCINLIPSRRKSMGVSVHYTSIFPQIFGNITVRRYRLGLSDGDPSEHQTFENNTLIDEAIIKVKSCFIPFVQYGNPSKKLFLLGSQRIRGRAIWLSKKDCFFDACFTDFGFLEKLLTFIKAIP